MLYVLISYMLLVVKFGGVKSYMYIFNSVVSQHPKSPIAHGLTLHVFIYLLQ